MTGVTNQQQLLTSSVMKFSHNDYQKNWKSLIINGRSNTHLLLWIFQFHFILCVHLLMLKMFFDEKIRSLDPPLEVIKVTSKLDSWEISSKMYDSKPQITFTQRNDPNNKRNIHLWKYCSCCFKPTNSVSNCFRKQR